MAKQKLIENILVPARLFEKIDTPLREAVVGDKAYPILAVYRFPFTRPGQKNLNGRTYPYALWDRQFAMNITTVSLVNHPEDDGDPARIWAVMKNAGYSEDRTLGMVDCYIIDNEFGKTAVGVLAAGGDIGLSSSGLGDFEVDGETVAPDSYELERWADWVLSPSYSVFGKIDDRKSEAVMADPKQEKTNDTPVIPATRLREDKTGAGMKTLSLRDKRGLEVSLKNIYEDIKSVRNVRERLDRAKEALTFYEDTDIEFYKGEFEELVKETGKEFEATLAKGEQADAMKKESEETSQMAKEARKEAEDLKKENDLLKKENERLKAKVEESLKMKDESGGLLAAMAESARRSIPYEKYEELRLYAIKAAKLYSEMKSEKNLLRIRVQELLREKKAVEESRMAQYQKDAAARAHIEELRQRNAEARALSERRLREAREAEFMRTVNPNVLLFYEDLIRVNPEFKEYRNQILERKTETEAQMLVLKLRHGKTREGKIQPISEGFMDRDLSAPLPVKNYRQVLPDTPMVIPKGFI